MSDYIHGFAPIPPLVSSDGAAGTEWYTPQWLLDWLPPIALDPCWSEASLVHADRTFDLRRGEDGLTQPWTCATEGIVFVNPPFDNTAAWLRKCRVEASRCERVIVALVPAYAADGPWHSQVWGFAKVVGFICGRCKFRDPAGRMETKGRGHALVIYAEGFCSDLAVNIVRRHIADASYSHPQAPVWVRQW